MPTTTEHETATALLAATPLADLMRNAYALTHRIHEESAESTPTSRACVVDLRAQRDLIDGEIARRITESTDKNFDALVTIETVERLAFKANTLLGKVEPGPRVQVVRDVLDSLMERTTNTTCTQVKSLSLSDKIAAAAKANVAATLTMLGLAG